MDLTKQHLTTLSKAGDGFTTKQQKVIDAVIFEYTDWTNKTNLEVIRQNYMDVISDALFKAPAVRSAKAFVKHDIDTYLYCFDHFVSSHIPPIPPWAGVIHTGDVKYVFGEPFLNYNNSVSEAEQNVEIKFSKEIISKWSSFAKIG